MPYFETEIDVEEFLSMCNKRELKQLAESLEDYGYEIKSVDEDSLDVENTRNITQIFFQESLQTIERNYFKLTTEELSVLDEISKKYKYF